MNQLMNQLGRRTLVSNYQATIPYLKNRGATDSSLKDRGGAVPAIVMNCPA
jgi:hypothetical protein